MKIKITTLSLLFIFLLYQAKGFAFENKIILKVNNEIVTSLDLENEIKYLQTLNPNLKNLSQKEIKQISKKSIIKERIKRLEIEKFFLKPEVPREYLEKLLKNIYSQIGLNNLNDFKKYLKLNNVKYKNVTKKIETEALWNELIVIKFSPKIKINEDELKKKVLEIKNKNSKSYLMSEIFFELDNRKDLSKKYAEIEEMIKLNGFDNAALKYSVSQTSNLGGKLDWISENSLNKEIKEVINKTEVNEYTKPISVSGGFLILKINEIKIIETKIDESKELKKLIRASKNNQLNQYSKIHFNKVKKDIQINEI